MARSVTNAPDTTREQRTDTGTKRYARLLPFWRLVLLTSFFVNLALFAALIGLGGFVLQNFNRIAATTANTQNFARNNVAELRDVVGGLQDATIRSTISISQPLNLMARGVVVPVDQQTVVTLVEPVPLELANADIDLGGGNRLRAQNISLQLPVGTKLNIALKMDIPLDPVTIPVVLEVPVVIPLKDTELGPQFDRLGLLVDRLVSLADPVLGLGVEAPPPAPTAAPTPTRIAAP